MEKTFKKILEGYRLFRKKYAEGDNSIMRNLAVHGQKPEIMVVSCCDSRVDPALILQCKPGDLLVVRNVANIVPPYEKDEALHGTSAALEFGVRLLKVRHLILLGHSQCAGIDALLNSQDLGKNDFISKWVSSIKIEENGPKDCDEYAKLGLRLSYINCLTFPWIKKKIEEKSLMIHRWFFDIKKGQIFTYSEIYGVYQSLNI
ncbi:MAG: carbonic anhydrase [Rickettsiella sp.]|nr:carbonic anhydrase [Rickettsiella sp.]